MGILVNKGGRKGDRGSSGMAPGLHIYFQPAIFNPIELFVKTVVDILTMILKISNTDIKMPKIPGFSLKGTAFGISVEEDGIRFKLNIIMDKKSLFSLKCVLNTKSFSDFDLDCDFDGNLIQMIKAGAKIILKYVKKGFLAAKKAICTFGVAVKDKAVEIYGKMKKKAISIYKKAKKFAENMITQAKAGIKRIEKEIKIAGKKLKKTLKYI